MATTHHGELKLFAHSTPGVVNAAVEFDPVTPGADLPHRHRRARAAATRWPSPPASACPRTILRAAQESTGARRSRDRLAALRPARRARGRREGRVAPKSRPAVVPRTPAPAPSSASPASTRNAPGASTKPPSPSKPRSKPRAKPSPAPNASPSGRPEPSPSRPMEIAEAREAIVAGRATPPSACASAPAAGAASPASALDQIVAGVHGLGAGHPDGRRGALSRPTAAATSTSASAACAPASAVGQIVRVETGGGRVFRSATSLPTAPSYAPQEIEVRGQTLDEALPQDREVPRRRLPRRPAPPARRPRQGHRQDAQRRPRSCSRSTRWSRATNSPNPAEGGEGVTVVDMAIG